MKTRKDRLITCYKVVYCSTDWYSLCKCLSSACIREDIQVEYKPKKWARPKIVGSPLYVFTNKKDAINFVEHVGGSYCEIWKAKAVLFQRKWKFPPVLFSGITGLRHVVKLRKNHKKYSHLLSQEFKLPEGTLLVQSVKLLKKVRWYD